MMINSARMRRISTVELRLFCMAIFEDECMIGIEVKER